MKKTGLILVALLVSPLAIAQEYESHPAEGTLPQAEPQMMTTYSDLNYNHSPEGTLPYAMPEVGTANRGGLMNTSYSEPHYFVHPGEGSLPDSTGNTSTNLSIWH